MPVRRGGAKGFLEGNRFTSPKARLEKFVGLCLDPVGNGEFRRPAVGRVIFEAAVMRRIMRGRDDNAVGQSCLAPAIVSENRVRNCRGRRVFIAFREHDFHPIGRQHLQRAGQSRHGKRMRVHAQKQRAVDVLLRSIQANSLGDGQDMPFIESLVECGTAMSRGAEGHPLRRHGRVRQSRCSRP